MMLEIAEARAEVSEVVPEDEQDEDEDGDVVSISSDEMIIIWIDDEDF